jgi:hypothetical protein
VQREEVTGLGLIDEDVDLLRGMDVTSWPGLNRILISISYNFFSRSSSPKNSEIKRAWLGAV